MNRSAVGKSLISMSGFKLAASAASPAVSTAEVRRKLRRSIAELGVAISVTRVGGGGDFCFLAQRMRARCGFTTGEFWRVWIMAVHALFAIYVAKRAIPKSAG